MAVFFELYAKPEAQDRTRNVLVVAVAASMGSGQETFESCLATPSRKEDV